MIAFDCASCGKHFQVDDALAGKRGRCKQCGAVFAVPAESSPIDLEPLQVVQAARPAPQISPPAPAGQNVQVVVQGQGKSANGLGVAGVILGILVLLGAWVPVVGLATIPLAFLGGLLAAVGLVVALSSGRSGVAWPIAGCALNATGLIVAVVVNLVLAGSLAPAVRAARDQARAAQAKRQAEEATRQTPMPVPAADAPSTGP